MESPAGFVHQRTLCVADTQPDFSTRYSLSAGDRPALLFSRMRIESKGHRNVVVGIDEPSHIDVDGINGFRDTMKYCHTWTKCISADGRTVVLSFSTPRRLRAISLHDERAWNLELPLLPSASETGGKLIFSLDDPLPEEDFDCASHVHCAFGLVAAILFSFRVATFDLRTGKRLGLSTQFEGRRVGQLKGPSCVAVVDPRTVAVPDEPTRRITLFNVDGTVRSTMNMYSFGRMRIVGMVQHAPGEFILLDLFSDCPVVVANARPPVRIGELRVDGTIESIAKRSDGNCAVSIYQRSEKLTTWAVLHTWTLRMAWMSGCVTLSRARGSSGKQAAAKRTKTL
jgi:hypothetical protein